MRTKAEIEAEITFLRYMKNRAENSDTPGLYWDAVEDGKLDVLEWVLEDR